MFLKHRAFGIDISDVSIKVAMLKKEGKELILSSFNRQEIPEGAIEQGKIKNEKVVLSKIKKAISEVKGETVKTPFCVTSLPETESFIRLIQLPEMPKEQIKEAIKWEAEATIPHSYQDIYLDWQIIPSAKKTDKIDILLGALPRGLVDDYLTLLKKARLQPIVFEIESVATARALIRNNQSDSPVLIIDLGAKKTSFIIFYGQTIHFTASLPFSNYRLIKEIANRLKIEPEMAKKLKFEIGLQDAKKKTKIYPILKPPLMELAENIKKYIEFYKTHPSSGSPSNIQVKKVLLCGGGANLAGLAEFLSQELTLEVEIGNPWVNILESAPKKIPEISYEESIAFSTALGLALRKENL